MTTIVQVEAYDNFQRSWSTKSIWVHPDKGAHVPPSLLFEDSNDTVRLYKQLKGIGYKEFKTSKVTVGGNL